jgi:DNA repair protein RAD5
MSSDKLRREDPSFHAVVFSQFTRYVRSAFNTIVIDCSYFTSFMDLIQAALSRNDFECSRFDGTMDMKKRSAAVTAFKAPSKSPKIMIISLKAGGVGLNVSHWTVFLIEEQQVHA